MTKHITYKGIYDHLFSKHRAPSNEAVIDQKVMRSWGENSLKDAKPSRPFTERESAAAKKIGSPKKKVKAPLD